MNINSFKQKHKSADVVRQSIGYKEVTMLYPMALLETPYFAKDWLKW